MKWISDQETDLVGQYKVGGKAKNLFRLKEMGLNVPKWIVIPQEIFQAVLPQALQNKADSMVIDDINKLQLPHDLIDSIAANFPPDTLFAVRSSATDEDGSNCSFAGQFDSFLFVTKDDLAGHIKKVWCSAFSERVNQYRANNNLEKKNGIAVIVQQMIAPSVSGVAFGINPANGDRQTKLISAVYGIGEGLVSGVLDADNFWVKGNRIEFQLADKTQQMVRDISLPNKTKLIPVENNKRKTATLTEQQVLDIAGILDQCFQEYGQPQDIEFAILENEIYLLQARPITNLSKVSDSRGEYLLWDNSNIIESYPGVTTPLTFSFISQSYEGAYKMFSLYMGVSPKVIEQNERVFTNTLGLIKGRVYYNLKTWYHMLAMLPGYSINARFMEKMMGVKERFDIPESYRLSKGLASWNVLKMAVKMTWNFLSLPKKRKAFKHLLDSTITRYQQINYTEKNANQLMQLYLDFEKTLLQEWKAPLLNDFFAMVWFGLLQKRCTAYLKSDNVNIHNDLLCGSSDIISTQPIHRSIQLATLIAENVSLQDLFLTKNEKEIWKILAQNNTPDYVKLKKEIEDYLRDFGDRCVGELKLETISYNQAPTKFVKTLKSLVETGITSATTSNKTEEEIRSKAEAELNETLKYQFFKKRKLARTLRITRELVSARENLRYERTRAFGIVRNIFTHLGKYFFAEGIIADPRDIFYLTKEELFSFIEGRAVTQNLQALIALRKEEFSNYQKQNVPSERFATFGAVYHANDFFSTSKLEKISGDLKGIGCCPGIVRARVQVITDPEKVTSLNGDILVTSSTDPGWVTLFPSAAAIIVERGSLLSHSAIVAREMGKPCIVSVPQLLHTLNTGDEIEMDGSTGEIKILHQIPKITKP